MCIIIDTNTFASVFLHNSSDHADFKLVYEWIKNGKGKMVYGGSTYKKELSKTKYIHIFTEFSKQRKTIKIDDREVDTREEIVKSLETDADFDDAHIVAIVGVSNCRLICTKDSRAHVFIKKRKLYPKKVSIPRIYSNPKHKHLLCDSNIVNLKCVCNN